MSRDKRKEKRQHTTAFASESHEKSPLSLAFSHKRAPWYCRETKSVRISWLFE